MTIEAQPRETFWSRRLRSVRAEAEAETEQRAAQDRAALEARQAARSDAEILEELGLKDPDLLTAGDDFAAFMNSAVPERLRRRALRVLWRSNPVLANLDGLVDHGEDFSDAAMAVPDLATAYQVGRGMLEHVKALARAESALSDEATGAGDATDTAEPPAAAPDPEEGPRDGTEMPATALAEDTAVPSEDAATASDQVPADLPRPRHMRFAFADET